MACSDLTMTYTGTRFNTFVFPIVFGYGHVLQYFVNILGSYCDVQINKCESNPCYGTSSCYDTVNAFVCICPAGYYGYRCRQQVDFCIYNECSVNSTCVSGTTGYTCHCSPGYTGELHQVQKWRTEVALL